MCLSKKDEASAHFLYEAKRRKFPAHMAHMAQKEAAKVMKLIRLGRPSMPTCLGSSAPEDLNCLAPIQAAQNEIHFFPASKPAPVENLSGQGNQNEKVKDAAVNQEDHKDPF